MYLRPPHEPPTTRTLTSQRAETQRAHHLESGLAVHRRNVWPRRPLCHSGAAVRLCCERHNLLHTTTEVFKVLVSQRSDRSLHADFVWDDVASSGTCERTEARG